MQRPPSSHASSLSLLLQRIDAASDGATPADTVATGFPSADEVLGGGLRRGDLVVLGGDAGSGKSALALAIALRIAEAGRAVTFMSGEMSPDRLLERVLAIEARARVDNLRKGTLDADARAALGAAAVRLRDQLPLLERLPAGGINELTDHLRRALDVEAVVIDSLASLPTGGVPQDEELAAAVRQLKVLAVDTGLAILLTAHLPGLDRNRANPRPTLDDFGALGAVKQHADVVLSLYREEMYSPELTSEGATEFAVLKNRSGAPTYVDLYFYKEWLRFEDMVEPDR